MTGLGPTKVELLELDIDCRLHALWAEVPVEADLDTLAPFMRAAFGAGYVQALADDGELCTVHGYRKPRRC